MARENAQSYEEKLFLKATNALKHFKEIRKATKESSKTSLLIKKVGF